MLETFLHSQPEMVEEHPLVLLGKIFILLHPQMNAMLPSHYMLQLDFILTLSKVKRDVRSFNLETYCNEPAPPHSPAENLTWLKGCPLDLCTAVTLVRDKGHGYFVLLIIVCARDNRF